MIPTNLTPEALRQTLSQVKKPGVAKSQARVLPVKYEHVMEVDWFRQMTWKERFKIFLGYNLNVLIRIRVKHNPADFDPIIVGEVTKFNQPSELLRSRIEKELAKLNTAPTIE